jgi:hypothetical protein
MPVDTQTQRLLKRWRSLVEGEGLQRAATMAWVLWAVGLVATLFVVFAIFYHLHPALVAGAAAVAGWVIAERNALRMRISQWPIFKTYIDWKRVEEDLKDAT